MMNENMQAYYAQRAAEYDRIYDKPERQADLSRLKAALSRRFKGLDVLELACGTGYWTQYLAKSANSIHATDYNTEMIGIAARRDYANCPVSFSAADAYSMPEIAKGFKAGFAGFLWSHVPQNRRSELITSFHSHLTENALVVWLDGRYVEGSSTPIARSDSEGNTYQIRRLSDGSQYEIIKNYPSKNDLIDIFSPFASSLEVDLFQYFWLLSYNVKKPFEPVSKGSPGNLWNF